MILGFMRISTQKEKQTTDRQRITLEQYAAANKFKFDKMLEERISGTIRADHRLVYNDLKADGIRIIALDTPYLNEWEKIQDSNIYNMIADIFIILKAHMAQQEREKTVQRIKPRFDSCKG